MLMRPLVSTASGDRLSIECVKVYLKSARFIMFRTSDMLEVWPPLTFPNLYFNFTSESLSSVIWISC